MATATDERLLLAGVEYITRHGIDITQGRNNWLAIGSCVKSILGNGGEDVFITLSCHHPKFREYDARKTYRTISGSGYGIGVFASACSRGLAVCRELRSGACCWELRSGGKKTEAYDFATHRFVILRINTIFA